MSLIYLTAEELKGITGYSTPSAQVRWLQMNGFTVLLRGDGKPLISRAHFEIKMGGFLNPTKQQEYQPNLGAI